MKKKIVALFCVAALLLTMLVSCKEPVPDDNGDENGGK